MSQKKRALVVLPYDFGLKEAMSVARLFLSFPGWEVKFLTPTDKHVHPASVIILPNTGGIYPFASYFYGNVGVVPPQDNAIEEFRLKTLHYYMQKGTGIFGLGSSAYLTFAEVLGGKLDVIPGSTSLVYAGDIHKKAYFEGETFYSQKPGALCAGMGNYELNEDLVAFVEQVFFCPPPEAVPVMVTTNSSPTQPVLAGRRTLD